MTRVNAGRKGSLASQWILCLFHLIYVGLKTRGFLLRGKVKIYDSSWEGGMIEV